MTHRLPHRLTPRFVPLAAIALLTLSAALGGPIAAQDRPAPDTTTTLPLKTARTHTFTTTKGSWLSLDVSPDGSRFFLVVPQLYGRSTPVSVIFNWRGDLERALRP